MAYYFTEKEKKIMMKYYEKEGYQIEKRLKNRSRDAIRMAAISLGLQMNTKMHHGQTRRSTY